MSELAVGGPPSQLPPQSSSASPLEQRPKHLEYLWACRALVAPNSRRQVPVLEKQRIQRACSLSHVWNRLVLEYSAILHVTWLWSLSELQAANFDLESGCSGSFAKLSAGGLLHSLR